MEFLHGKVSIFEVIDVGDILINSNRKTNERSTICKRKLLHEIE